MKHVKTAQQYNIEESIALVKEATPKLINALRIGNFRDTACRVAGITPRVFQMWMVKGLNSVEGPYRDFRDLVLLAESESEFMAVGELQKAGKKDARHIQFLLQNGPKKKRWTDPKRVEVSGPGGAPLEVRKTLDASVVKDELSKALEAIRDAEALGLRIPSVQAPRLAAADPRAAARDEASLDDAVEGEVIANASDGKTTDP